MMSNRVTANKTTANSLVIHLEVNNDGKHQNSGEKIHQVWKILSVERFPKRSNLVLSGSQQVEESDHGSFEFRATTYMNEQ